MTTVKVGSEIKRKLQVLFLSYECWKNRETRLSRNHNLTTVDTDPIKENQQSSSFKQQNIHKLVSATKREKEGCHIIIKYGQ